MEQDWLIALGLLNMQPEILPDCVLSKLNKDQIGLYLRAKSDIHEASKTIDDCMNRINDYERYIAQAEESHKRAIEMIAILKKAADLK